MCCSVQVDQFDFWVNLADNVQYSYYNDAYNADCIGDNQVTSPAQVAQSCRAGNYLFASQQGPLVEEGEKQLQLEMDLLGKYGKATGTYGFSSNAVDRYSVTGYGTWMDAPGARRRIWASRAL